MNADPAPAAKKPKRPRPTPAAHPGAAHVSTPTPRLPRVYRACESCRRKKVKCDGVEPVCGQCLGSVNPCTWKPTADRAAHSRQYVQQLENQLHQYQELFQQVAPAVVEALGGGAAGAGNGVQVGEAAREYVRTMSAQQPIVKDEEPEGDDDEYDESESASTTDYDDGSEEDVTRRFGQLTLDEHGHLRYIGSASALSLIETFRTISRHQHPIPSQNPSAQGTASAYVNDLLFPPSIGIGKVRTQYLPRSREAEYPPRDLADTLVSAYFEKFHPTLPVLDKVSWLEKYRDHMDSGAYRDDPGFQSTIFGAFAVAARFVKDERLGEGGKDGGLGSTFYDRAMILHFIGATKTQLSHVQCVVLLSSYLASWNCLPESWLLLGQAVRTAQDLGLHRAVTKSPLTPLEVEMYKRIWWCVYILDRFLAIALGRPLGIEDSDCDVDLPTPLDDDDLRPFFDGRPPTPPRTSTMMIGFTALARLAKLGGQMMRQVYAVGAGGGVEDKAPSEQDQRTVERLDDELTRWCDSLPANLRSKPTGPRETVMAAVLCTSYYSILISLHRVFLPTASRRHHSHIGTMSQGVASSVQKAVSASRNCILLAKALRNIIFPSHHLAFFVQYLFSSAAILCLCALRFMEERLLQQTLAEVDQCIECLTALESTYPGAAKCRELLLKLVQVTKDHAAKKRERGHLTRTGSTRKVRRQSNKTGSTGSASPSDWTGKRPTITPPREMAPGSSGQGNHVSPRQAAALPQFTHLQGSGGSTPQSQSSHSSGSSQHVFQAAPQRPTFSSNPLRPGVVPPPSLSTPTYMQNPAASASTSSFNSQMEAHTGQKRSRQESAAGNIVGSSYIPTFGPNQQPLRHPHTHSSSNIPPPIPIPANVNPGIVPSLTTGNEFRMPASVYTPPQGSSGSATPSYNLANVQPDWGNVQIKQEPGTSPGQGVAYTPSPPAAYGSSMYDTTPPYASGSTPPYASGSNGLQFPSFDMEGLSLPPLDMEFMNSLGQGWLDVPMDDSMGMDPAAFNLNFNQEPVFPFTLERQSNS